MGAGAVGAESLRALVGKDMEPSAWKRMAFEDIQGFADVTGDHQWVHVDRARIEKESPFGAPIAHGYFSLALIGGLFLEAVDVTRLGFRMGVNYGLNKVRFPRPLKEGDEYRLRPKVASVKAIDDGVEVVFVNTLEVKGADKPCCVAECVYRFCA